MSSVAPAIETLEWNLPDRGPIGVTCLIITEAALFTIFVAAYVYYIGQSRNGPFPHEVLEGGSVKGDVDVQRMAIQIFKSNLILRQ